MQYQNSGYCNMAVHRRENPNRINLVKRKYMKEAPTGIAVGCGRSYKEGEK
jgi:hypothetical protein